MLTRILIIGTLLLISVGVGLLLIVGIPSLKRTSVSSTSTLPSPGEEAFVSPAPLTQKTFSTRDVPGIAPAFQFSASTPTGWAVEAVPQIEAINLFDPAAEDATNLEKSQIFIRYFRANRFLTLTTVNILERTEHTLFGKPTVNYFIEKKSGVPNFVHQPAWRNTKHRVTDIRVSDDDPSFFYVFAKRPGLSDEAFDRFLQSLSFNKGGPVFYYPIENFPTGITKKQFGIFVSPEQSPISPERFQGYHTGVDIEVEARDKTGDIPVFAIAEGTVVLSQRASGYGGVLAIRHMINKETILAIYGHMRPGSMPRVRARIGAGERIGVLGRGFSEETDGERRHLHFGLWRGSEINIQGYVTTKEELVQWYNPVRFLAQGTLQSFLR